jgi:hypothetical protein
LKTVMRIRTKRPVSDTNERIQTMKRLFLATLALLAMCGASQASITANAYLSITNLKVIDVSSGLPVVAGFGQQVLVTPGGSTSITTAELDGFGSTFDLNLAGLDAAVSYVGNGAAPSNNDIFTVLPTTMGNPAGLAVTGPAEHYALADTVPGTGSAVSTTTTPAAGASGGTFAELSLDETVAPALGMAATTATGVSSVSRLDIATGNSPITVRIDFDALSQIFLDYLNAPPPDGLLLKGSTSFSISITGSGTNAAGTSISLSESYVPFQINTGDIVNSLAGTQQSYTFSGPLSSQSVTLERNGNYTFTISQGSSAAVDVVPEPASMIAWSVLGACVALPSFLRRNKK